MCSSDLLYADTPNTAWVCHKAFYWNVMQKLMLAQGGTTLTETADGIKNPMFLGYPVRFAQKMPGTSASGQISCYFGDMSLAVMFGERRQITLAQSTEYKWDTDQLAIRGTERFDINPHDVGDASTVGPLVALKNA